MSGAEPGPLERMQLALAVHLAWEEEGRPVPAAELLARHADLEEFLAPLLEEEEGRAEEEGGRRRLGEFELLREIGRGGMGVVYEAHQLSLDRRVALKVLPAHLTLRPASVARFRREALTAAALDHPGLVKVLAVGGEGDAHFFAMEFIEGAPLSRVLERMRGERSAGLTGGSLASAVTEECHRPTGGERAKEGGGTPPGGRSWQQGHIQVVLELAIQVAEALDYAHQAGVIHRDVKPSNILVRRDGSAVLTDFGLARESGLPSMTMTGEFVGTPYYVSPEQAEGRGGGIDGRTDIFSLGATLYEALTLERPFTGGTNREILGRIITEEPPDPRRHNPRIPSDLAAIVLKALAKEPAHRYRRAADLAEDLRAFLAFRPVTAKHATLATRLWRWGRREPVKAALVAVLALAVPCLTALGGYVLAKQGEIEFGERVRERQEIEGLLGRAFLLLGDEEEEARDLLERVLAREEENLDALLGLALIAWWEDRPRELRALLAERADVLSRTHIARTLWANCARAGGARPPEGVERLYRPAQGGEKAWSATDLFFTSIYLNERFRRTVDERERRQALAHVRRAVLLAPRPRAVYFYQLALFPEGGADAARALGRFWPDDGIARLYRAIGLAWSRPQEAARLFAELPPENRSNHVFIDHHSTCLRKLGRGEEAIALQRAYLDRLGERGAARARVCYNLGVIHSELGRKEEAETWYRRAIAAWPGYPKPYNNLGMLLLGRGRTGEALELLQRGEALEPDYWVLLSTLARAWRKAGEPEKFVATARRALAINPDIYNTRRTLADHFRRTGRREEAERHYRILVERHPELAEGCNGMGLLERDDRLAAHYWFRRAVEVEPGDFGARMNLAVTLIRLGDKQGALPHMEKAVDLRPRSAAAHRNLLLLCGDLGRHAEARREHERWLARPGATAAGHLRFARFLTDPELPAAHRDPAAARRHLDRAAQLLDHLPPAKARRIRQSIEQLRRRL